MLKLHRDRVRLDHRRPEQFQRHVHQRPARQRAPPGQRRSGPVGQHVDALHGPGRRIARRAGPDHQHSASGRSGRTLADRSLGDAGGRKPHLRLPGRDAAELVARPGAEQFAGDVSHGAGRQPHVGHRPVLAAHYGVDLRMGRGRPRLHHAGRPGHQEPPAESAPYAERRPRRRPHQHQQDDSRLRHRAERGRAHQRRPPGRSLESGGQHRADGRARGDLRAHARPL